MTPRILLGTLLLVTAVPLRAQVGDTTQVPVDSVIVTPKAKVAVEAAADTVRPMAPRDAMIRSMIVPGWGQAAFGSYFRGGIYFAGWAGNWYMDFRNVVRVHSAEQRFDRRRTEITDALVASSPNPDSMQAQIDSFPALVDSAVRADSAGNDLRKLVRGRKQQRQDWIAWSIFWLLASGVDAYVNAHLSDFPAAIDVEPAGYRAASLGLRITLPPRRP